MIFLALLKDLGGKDFCSKFLQVFQKGQTALTKGLAADSTSCVKKLPDKSTTWPGPKSGRAEECASDWGLQV